VIPSVYSQLMSASNAAPGGTSAKGTTVTSTVSSSVPPRPSSTTTWKVSVPVVDGALNDGVAVFAPVSVTAGPPVWLQAYVRVSPFGSLLSVPSSATPAAPMLVANAAPASAVGGTFGWTSVTLTTTVSAGLVTEPSPTTRRKVSGPVTFGAVNVGLAVAAPLSVTLAPPVCVQA